MLSELFCNLGMVLIYLEAAIHGLPGSLSWESSHVQ